MFIYEIISSSFEIEVVIFRNSSALTLEASKKKIVYTRSFEGWGGREPIGPPPYTLDTIHLIDMKFGTYNKLHLDIQLRETTWCLVGFHGNNSQIHDVTVGRHLGFLNFQILFKFLLLYLKLTGKQHLTVEIHESCQYLSFHPCTWTIYLKMSRDPNRYI